MKLLRVIISVFPVILLLILFFGCANQQAPGGGEEDKIPPKVKIEYPDPNSINFKGRSISFSFNEYVDKRSFQDAFRISPSIKGDIEFNWGSKDVEIVFPGNLQTLHPNKTFVINIGTGLQDIHGNPIEAPVNFAFSTGQIIDMGSISGAIYNSEQKKIISIFAYRLGDNIEYDPTKNIPDYLTEASSDGNYILTNLAPANYRVISVNDEDRNLLFTSDRESYGVLSYDIQVPDSGKVEAANFYMKQILLKEPLPAELDHTKYFKDSLDIVYSSVENDSRVVSPDQSIFIYFNRKKPTREEFISSAKITGEENQTEKIVFNWRNDSLVEMFAANKFKPNYSYKLTFSLVIGKDSVYSYILKFKTVGVNSFGEVKGSVKTNYENIVLSDYNTKIELEAKDVIPVVKYSFDSRDTVFSFANILEAEYLLFSFIDLNSDNSYNFGYPFPFQHSEPFFIYPQSLRIRGGWTVENVVISFNK